MNSEACGGLQAVSRWFPCAHRLGTWFALLSERLVGASGGARAGGKARYPTSESREQQDRRDTALGLSGVGFLAALAATAITAGGAVAGEPDRRALPQGGSVSGGRADIDYSGDARLDVRQHSDRAIIDWRSFDVGAAAHTNFSQPDAGSIAVNRVSSGDPSQIMGRLSANGRVVVLNPNGVVFGRGARIDVGGIVASTGSIDRSAFMAGAPVLSFGDLGNGSVVNEGQISIRDGGLAAFVAPVVENSGVIRARSGRIALAGGGAAFTLDLYGDRLVNFVVEAPTGGRVDNAGGLIAEGGIVELTTAEAGDVVGSVINTSGVVSVASVRVDGGTIVLAGADASAVTVGGDLAASGQRGGQIDVAGGDVTVAAEAALDASGIDGDGGRIDVLSTGATIVDGRLSARGAGTGAGGHIETSSDGDLGIGGTTVVDVGADRGSVGTWLLDPDSLFIATAGDSDLTGPATGDHTVAASAVVAALSTGNVTLAANTLIQVDALVDASAQANGNTLALTDQNADGDLTVTLNDQIRLAAGQQLTGQASQVKLAASAIVQNGVDVAAAGATLTLAAGTFFDPATITIGKDLVLQGQGADATVVSGNNAFRVFQITAGNVALNGLGIVDGLADDGAGIHLEAPVSLSLSDSRVASNNATDDGGGIFNAGGAVELVRTDILDNTAGDEGGGVFSNRGAVTVTGSTVSGNVASDHGGGMRSQSGRLDIADSLISGNESTDEDGGGVAGLSSVITIARSTVSGNTSLDNAGGVENTAGTLDIVDSTISGNTATTRDGGGISTNTRSRFAAPTTTIRNSTISGNTAGDDGGGLHAEGRTGIEVVVTVSSSTISGNEAGDDGGGLQVIGRPGTAGGLSVSNSTITGNIANDRGGALSARQAALQVDNSIVAGNTAASRTELDQSSSVAFVSNSFNLIGENNDAGSFPVAGNLLLAGSIDTVLGPLADNGGFTFTHALAFDSPAIDTADPAFAAPPDTDQRGFQRVFGGGLDIGAFESRGFALLAVGGTPQDAEIGTPFADELKAQITDTLGVALRLPGIDVTFDVPATGASATADNLTVVTNADGLAGIAVTANDVAGAFSVNAGSGSLTPVVFALSNIDPGAGGGEPPGDGGGGGGGGPGVGPDVGGAIAAIGGAETRDILPVEFQTVFAALPGTLLGGLSADVVAQIAPAAGPEGQPPIPAFVISDDIGSASAYSSVGSLAIIDFELCDPRRVPGLTCTVSLQADDLFARFGQPDAQ